jgi:hypothetical protein
MENTEKRGTCIGGRAESGSEEETKPHPDRPCFPFFRTLGKFTVNFPEKIQLSASFVRSDTQNPPKVKFIVSKVRGLSQNQLSIQLCS